MITPRTAAVIVSLFFALTPLVYAQATNPPIGSNPSNPPIGTNPSPTPIQNTGVNGQNVTLVNPLGAGTSLNVLIADILQFVIRIGAVIVVFMLVYVGFLFVTARGNETQISQAREALTWTIVGALILLGAQAIALGLQATVQALSTGS